MKRYWLIKTEPECYSIDDLERDGRTHWDGVRNYLARNYMRDEMKIGDEALFYHSNCEPPGAAGIARVCSKPYADFTAWDPKDKHFDPKSPESKPVWMMVDFEFVEKFPRFATLEELKKNPKLEGMVLLQRGSRLSVQPASVEHFKIVVKMGRGK